MQIVKNDDGTCTVIYQRKVEFIPGTYFVASNGTDQIRRWFQERQLIVKAVSYRNAGYHLYAVSCDAETAMLAKLTWGGDV